MANQPKFSNTTPLNAAKSMPAKTNKVPSIGKNIGGMLSSAFKNKNSATGTIIRTGGRAATHPFNPLYAYAGKTSGGKTPSSSFVQPKGGTRVPNYK